MKSSKKHLLTVLMLASFTIVYFSLALKDACSAEQNKPVGDIKTVTLKSITEGITPNILRVKLGTTIVWFNNDDNPVTIKFIDKLGIACKAPMNFYADLFGYYETGPIPEGGTASICFIYQGTYNYEVKRLVKKGDQEPIEEILAGKIIAVE